MLLKAEIISLVNAAIYAMFIAEPETYPVFIEWAKSKGFNTSVMDNPNHDAANLRDLAHVSAMDIDAPL